MSSIQTRHGSPFDPWVDRIWRRRVAPSVARRLRAFAAGWLRRRAMHQLARMDDRTLSDIGISRGEIEFAVRYSRDGDAVLSAAQTQARALAAMHFPPL